VENKKSICILGSGTYGSYIANVLADYPSKFDITILEVGGSKIMDESSIGFSAHKENNLNYAALEKGRYFGFGGSSSKWGGQLLFFEDMDFSKPSVFLKTLIDINVKYKSTVLARFGIKDRISSDYSKSISNKFFALKKGTWLSYFKRNLFNLFQIKKKENVRIISNARVISLSVSGQKIEKVNYFHDSMEKTIVSDYYFLTTGAFEASRILIDSGIIPDLKIKFSDHFSSRIFEVNGPTKIGQFDFTFNFNHDYSLVTNRLIGEIDGLSFFIHPIYNQNFLFFQNLKSLLFKGNFSFKSIFNVVIDFPYVLRFVFELFILRRLYVHKNVWYFQVDIESHTDISSMALTDKLDKFGCRTFDLEALESAKLTLGIIKIKELLRGYLKANNVKFKETYSDPTSIKLEDTYHPYNLFQEHSTVQDFYENFDNLLIVNTGILPRVGGINPTASLFPLIEDFIKKYLINDSNES